MRSKYKTVTFESLNPLFAVENDCIISKNADLTVGFRLTLPEIFTIPQNEYEALHEAWMKALKVLPDHTIVHKQDWFIESLYHPKAATGGSFLSRANERHFFERPYLQHTCYIYVTQTTPEQMRRQSIFSTLCRGALVPKVIRDPDTAAHFLDAVGQMAGILDDCGLGLHRLNGDEIIGSHDKPGILSHYFALSLDGDVVNEDIRLDPGQMQIGDKLLCLHTLSDLDALPQDIATDARHERYSTDRSDCRMSFAAPVGLLLPHSHIYNQLIFLDNHEETLRRFERTGRNMNALSRYSRANALNKEWIDLFLNEAYTENLRAVRCHCNILTWGETAEELKKIRNDVGAQIAAMGCTPHHNTVDTPALFWGTIPGNEADFPSEESFHTFLPQALCFFSAETNYRSSLSPIGIKLADRISGIPVHVDLSDEPMKRGITANRNRMVIGSSGSGKSFFVNHMMRSYYEQGAHCVIVDIGHSYKGLCRMIHQQTNGKDGLYFTYDEAAPISFNPFYSPDGTYDVEKRESLKTLILTLWKREDEPPTRAEEVALSNAVNLYLTLLKNDPTVRPCFDSFYEFISHDYRMVLEQKQVREKDFDLANFLNVLEPYYREGEYGNLLNSSEQFDLLDNRFIIFELDNIRDNKVLLPIVTLIIMDTAMQKMRRLQGIRKLILLEEVWKVLMRDGMADFVRYLFKTARKHYGETIVVSQEIDDIIGNPIVKDTIVNNSDCKILLDSRKFLNKFDEIQKLLGLTDKERDQVLSLNQANDPHRRYKEVWIGLGGVQSAVYAVEVSNAEYLVYTTEQSEKMKVFTEAERLGGDLEAAVRLLADQLKSSKK